ncbi:hypothetical protein Syun_026462 [Stephania yunnanensis]|uniref:mitogen-activated protein kinase kinase n=1 Tax=Stephania yunnanensis TaxID=152371 RepID=A0AAP0HVS3_9MAGN
MRRKGSSSSSSSSNPNKLRLALPSPDEVSFAKFLTQSGTFKEGDLLVNKDGVRVVSQSEEDAPPPIKPSDNQLSLADLDVIKVVGKGSSGIVQLVQHKWTGQFFALKAIQVNFQEDLVKLIAQELKINQSAQCPHVAVCYQSFYDNGVISIILEYMDGGSLADFLKKVKTIPEPYLAAITKQASPTRNLKFLFSQYVLWSSLNAFFMTSRSDIWSLGLALLECATGQFPYAPPVKEDGWTNCYELMEAIVDQPTPKVPPGEFSPHFSSFITTCLQKDPKDRGTAHALMDHPFIGMYDDLDIDLASYFTNAGSPLATFSTPICTSSFVESSDACLEVDLDC